MAGLSVLLEPHSKSHRGKTAAAQIISKTTLVIHKQQEVPVSPTTAAGSFLPRCCLCHGELAEGMDIYMYRGDRAFCSEECRCRQIVMDEQDAVSSCGNGNATGAGAATVHGSRRGGESPAAAVSPTEPGVGVEVPDSSSSSTWDPPQAW